MKKHRILIIEDSDTSILWYKGILSRLDIQIDVAKTIDEANSKLNDFDYFFHIIDITLTGDEKGYDIIGRYGVDPEMCLVISGTLPEDLVNKLVNIYGVPYSLIKNKPVDANELYTIVESKLEIIKHSNHTISESELEHDSNICDVISHTRSIPTIISFCKAHIASLIPIIIFTIVFFRFMSSYLRIDAYNEIYNEIQTRNEKLFAHYNPSNSITNISYVDFSGYDVGTILESNKSSIDKNIELYNYLYPYSAVIKRVRIKFFPNNNYLIIVIDSDNKIRHFWLSDIEYLTNLGVGQDFTFFEIFTKAWIESFSKL